MVVVVVPGKHICRVSPPPQINELQITLSRMVHIHRSMGVPLKVIVSKRAACFCALRESAEFYARHKCEHSLIDVMAYCSGIVVTRVLVTNDAPLAPFRFPM